MRFIIALLTAAFIVAINSSSFAGPLSPAQLGAENSSPIILAQAAKKDETVKQKVKRVWKNMTGYKFTASCPFILPLSQTSCTETGKNRAAAQAKCQSRHPFCYVAEAK
jgi:hypothetical protein